MEADDIINNGKYEDIRSLINTQNITPNIALSLYDMIKQYGYYEDIQLKFADPYNLLMMESYCSSQLMTQSDFLNAYGIKNLLPSYLYSLLDIYVRQGNKLKNTFSTDLETINGFEDLPEDIKNIFYIASSVSKLIAEVFSEGVNKQKYIASQSGAEISTYVKNLYVTYFEFFYSNGVTSDNQPLSSNDIENDNTETTSETSEKSKKSTPRRKTLTKKEKVKVEEEKPEVIETVSNDDIYESVMDVMTECWKKNDKTWKEFSHLPFYGMSDSDKKTVLENLSEKFELKLCIDTKTFDRYTLHIKLK